MRILCVGKIFLVLIFTFDIGLGQEVYQERPLGAPRAISLPLSPGNVPELLQNGQSISDQRYIPVHLSNVEPGPHISEVEPGTEYQDALAEYHDQNSAITAQPESESQINVPETHQVPSPVDVQETTPYYDDTGLEDVENDLGHRTGNETIKNGTEYLTEHSFEIVYTPWDSLPAPENPAECYIPRCDPDRNQVDACPVPCGTSPLQRPSNFTPREPPPGCYRNRDGYICCDDHVEQMLDYSYNNVLRRCKRQNANCTEHQNIADYLQEDLEKHFGKQYNSLVTSLNTVEKLQYYGQHICKIRRNCYLITAFASPNQEGPPIFPPGTELQPFQGFQQGFQQVPFQRQPFYQPQQFQQAPAPFQNGPAQGFQGPSQGAQQGFQNVAPQQQFQQAIQPVQQPAQQYYQGVAQAPGVAAGGGGGGGGACFSGDTEVVVYPGEYRMIRDLSLVDYVLTSNLKYSKVIDWLHSDPNTYSKFLNLYLNDGKSLKITEKHLIHKAPCSDMFNSTIKIEENIIFAEDLKINDCLYVVDQTRSEITIEEIIEISTTYEYGIYAPETSSGDIVVNHIVASCYTDMKNELVKTDVKIFKMIIGFINHVKSLFGGMNRRTSEIPETYGWMKMFLHEIIPLKYF